MASAASALRRWPAMSTAASARRWPRAAAELVREQEALARATPPPWRATATGPAAGCFVCFPRGTSGPGAEGEPAWAAAAGVRGGRLAGTATVEGTAGARYDPGLLALREGPLLEAAVRALPVEPELVLVNATGRDHPRGAGLALHLGAVLDLPTLGVTHRPLLAAGPWPAERRGATSPLRVGCRTVGCWLRTRTGVRPLAVHPGWRTDLEAAVAMVLEATRRARTPEPLRAARRLAREARARGEAAAR